MRFSVTSDMFNYSFKPGLEEKLSLFREYGFEYLHWCDNWNDDVLYTRDEMKQYARLITDAGLTCLDVHGTATHDIRLDADDAATHRLYVKLLRNRVEFCSAVGGDAVVAHPPHLHEPDLEKRLSRAAEALDAVRSLCGGHGVALALENCYRDDHRVLRRLLDEHPPEFLGFCYDSGHANIHGNFRQLNPFRERLLVTHLHDNRGDADSHQPPGWGTIDWGTVVGWLEGHGKPLNLEVTHSQEHFKGDPRGFLEAIRGSLKHLAR
ncbi:MAG: sugar phosphate isomerase/epimerase family protein [Candidatus Bathyarchaeota archaeon]